MAAPSGDKLTDDTELLYRQVHPGFVDDGRVSSQAFRPTKKDDGLLSMSRSSLTSPEAAYQLYTGALELTSAGMWGVTIGECEKVELAAYADPITEPIEDLSHSVIDFRQCSEKQTRKKGALLAGKARARGALFLP